MDYEIKLLRKIRKQILTDADLLVKMKFPAISLSDASGNSTTQILHIHEHLELRLLFQPWNLDENAFSALQELCLTPPEIPHPLLPKTVLKHHITLRIGLAEIYYMRGADYIETFDPLRSTLPPGLVLPNLICALEDIGYGKITDPEYIRTLLSMLFSLMIAVFENYEGTPIHSLAERIAAFIRANYFKTDLSIREIAEKHNLSPNYIQTLFRKRWGCSPLHYLNEVRLKNARLLLQKHRYQVKEVAAMCGWEYTHYFCKKYREYFGHLPSDE